MPESEAIFAEESYAIRGACFEVYRAFGCGYSEAIYQESLEIELGMRNVPFEAQCRIGMEYKGQSLRSAFQPDLVCYGKLIVELKAVRELGDEHRSQMLNYLKVTGHRLGLLVNFGHFPGVQIERMVR